MYFDVNIFYHVCCGWVVKPLVYGWEGGVFDSVLCHILKNQHMEYFNGPRKKKWRIGCGFGHVYNLVEKRFIKVF
jgi:hypothetical protein